MNKLYQRINWQNYPSDSTPLNESNLNKMDAAVDEIDDRVVTLDVTKLPVSTANTMVKDVTFNETTGVFTITKLNGTKVTVNTALEKIATNFRYDHSTQKLILTLIDGTTQEVGLSALLTQYEFLNSSTIQFTIDSSGKVKASVVNGSITGDMLEPNYLANVTLQASKADTSAKNAKESEEKAAEYAESAKNSADSAEPVASTATGTNPTIQDSTNAPFIYGKFKGYTLQDGEPTPDNPVEINGLAKDGAIEVKTTGKNVFSATLEDYQNNGTISGAGTKLYFKLKPNTVYTCSSNVSKYNDAGDTNIWFNGGSSYPNGVSLDNPKTTTTDNNGMLYVTLRTSNLEDLFNNYWIQVEEGDTATPYEPYTETTATITTDAPLYEGDYIEIYADGSGRLYKKFMNFNPTTIEAVAENVGAYIKLIKGYCKARSTALCNYIKLDTTGQTTGFNFGGNAEGNFSHFFIKVLGLTTKEEYQSWLNERSDLEVVYELAEPTETPLTAQQVAEFKKLYTFEPVTNVLCDGEVEMRYYKANVNGETVGIVHKKVEASEKTIEQLPNTFAKKSIYDNNAISYGRKVDSTVGEGSIAFGLEVEAPINYGVAVGAKTRAGDCAFACGHTNSANGLCSSASGFNTTVDGEYSHVEGAYTKASSNCQHVQGKYNVEDTEHKYAHIIGGGNSETDRKNIHTIDWNGNAEFAGGVKCSNVLKTLSECEASTTSTDIAGASALAELKDDFKSIILNSAYPVGTVYMSTKNTSPATFLGGTWSAISSDKYFKTITSGTGGSTGGSTTSGSTTLTVNQIPSHSHSDLIYGTGGGRIGMEYNGASGSNQYSLAVGSGTSIATQTAGGGQGHTHTINPPYYTVYAWVRTA